MTNQPYVPNLRHPPPPPPPPTVADYLSPFLSGESAFRALQQAVNNLSLSAPQDHDVLVLAFDVSVLKIGFVEPHTLLFQGVDGNGHETFAVCHFSQLVARVIYRPKQTHERVVTGFAPSGTL